jgi:predicted permease
MIRQDVKYAVRRMRRAPLFTGLAVLIIALGVSSATAIVSVIDAVLVHPLPYANAQDIYTFEIDDPANPHRGDRSWYTVGEFSTYADRVDAFSDVAGASETAVVFATDGNTQLTKGALVTGNMFHLLGVPALRGRTLDDRDAQPSAEPVFVMSSELWSREFGRDTTVLGRAFLLNGRLSTLVGIMPPRFTFSNADVWMPRQVRAGADDDNVYLLTARLRPGATAELARAEFAAVAADVAPTFARLYPKDFTVRAVSLVDRAIGPARPTLTALAIAAGLLLLIACVNVANMLLGQATTRATEMRIRHAVGASRWRLVRQLVSESLVLGVAGAVVGLAIVAVALAPLVRSIPAGLIPPEAHIALNVRVLLLSLAIATGTVLLFGLIPAFYASGRVTSLGRTPAGGHRQTRWSAALVACELSLTVALLVTSGVLIRTVVNLRAVPLGLDPNGVVYTSFGIPAAYRDPAARGQLYEAILAQVSRAPGVSSVALTSTLPLSGGIRTGVLVAGVARDSTALALLHLSTDQLFAVTRQRLLRGRTFTEREASTGARVAVVNQALATKYFGTSNPIGRAITLTGLARARVANPTFEVIGVVGDSKNHGIQNPALPEAYVASSVATAYGSRAIVARTRVSPAVLLVELRRSLRALDPNIVVAEAGTLRDVLSKHSYAIPEFATLIMGTFAAVGLILAALGVYGVVAHAVARRARELGIRLALGVTSQELEWRVVGGAMVPVAVGIVAGGLGSRFIARFVGAQLWGVKPDDLPTLLAVVVLVGLVGVAASYVPARRIARIDPAAALRME